MSLKSVSRQTHKKSAFADLVLDSSTPERRDPFDERSTTIFARMAGLDANSAEFNVSSYKKNEKLQKIIQNSNRMRAAGHILDRKARKEKRIARTEELVASKVSEYLEKRLLESNMARQNRYVRLGDEYRLKATCMYDGININSRDGYVSILEMSMYYRSDFSLVYDYTLHRVAER